MKKMFIYLFCSYLSLVLLACLYRCVNGKDSFVSLGYLLDYIVNFDFYGEFKNVIDSFGSAIENLVDTLANLPDLTANTSDVVIDVLRYVGSLLVAPIKVIIDLLLFVVDFGKMLLRFISWFFGFLPYVLAY